MIKINRLSLFLAVLAGMFMAGTPGFSRAASMMMVRSDACTWCEVWEEEIGGIWDKTLEGKTFPVMRHDESDPVPAGIHLSSPTRYTPTFIILDDQGQERARLNGYAGDQFFWPMIQDTFRKAGFAWPPQD